MASLYHTKWTSAKAAVPPDNLKKLNLSKGLGPAIEKLEKKADAADEMDTISPKAKSELD